MFLDALNTISKGFPVGFIATENDSIERLFPLGNLSESSYPE